MIITSEICAVITTFRPDASLNQRVEAISRQVGYVVVVDDTGHVNQLYSYLKKCNSITCLFNEENVGIAKSLNIAINHAIELGYDWILTLDDDTIVSSNYVSTLLDFYKSSKFINIGVIGLMRSKENSENLSVAEGEVYVKRTLITSGSFFNAKVFKAVKGFDEDFFIDLVDFDFCTRLRRNGYQILQLPKIGMKHKVGCSRIHYFFGVPIVVYNHLPFRLYYQLRNSLVFFRKNVFFDPILSVYILFDILRLPIKAILFENKKKVRIKYVLCGFWDGVKGKMGKVPVDFR